MIRTSVSALFLRAIALVNLVPLKSVRSHFKDVRRGERVGLLVVSWIVSATIYQVVVR